MAICRQVGDFKTSLVTLKNVGDWRFLGKMKAIFSAPLDYISIIRSGVSSLDSYSKDSYSSHFLADSTDSRV